MNKEIIFPNIETCIKIHEIQKARIEKVLNDMILVSKTYTIWRERVMINKVKDGLGRTATILQH